MVNWDEIEHTVEHLTHEREDGEIVHTFITTHKWDLFMVPYIDRYHCTPDEILLLLL